MVVNGVLPIGSILVYASSFYLPATPIEPQFIRYAQAQLPEIFDGREPPVFSLESPEDGTYAYDFKLQTLLTDKQQLLGVDRKQNQQPVFDALISPDEEPDIRLCKMPAELLASLVDSVQAEERQPSAPARETSSQPFELA
ncbi:MAG: hypothetical protein KME45_32905 [Stenomitos rutilans HA7619-LM2]|jgi:hypothetical protein|nr:hypothetical protein [Stenomitos rutilans HA7619-LM2]